ncbi:GYD domain-containing protein [Micromonospora sp. R77]|uniref:GYD domain-containing protein n=1 Tax=Micromonospora sp. R77 TaxID=2925836 RepID=UPI001F61C47E|nr:GYD domain-containing protein [Micromonospora sp. R77]MCI4064521.1 GYD domain-containing protein [Micromonospora sp. R77]
MAAFLLKSTYTVDGLGGLVRDGGTKRADVVRALVEDAGGRVESIYFAFAEEDTYVVCDLPDHRTAAALAIAIGAAGGLRVQVTPLLSPAEVDAATRERTAYTPPGD